MAAPALNRVVKDFKFAATGDQVIRLKSLRGKKVVLYFYPKDATPGCTTEGQDFRDLHALFKRQNAVILGVSRDSVASHEKFKENNASLSTCSLIHRKNSASNSMLFGKRCCMAENSWVLSAAPF